MLYKKVPTILACYANQAIHLHQGNTLNLNQISFTFIIPAACRSLNTGSYCDTQSDWPLLVQLDLRHFTRWLYKCRDAVI